MLKTTVRYSVLVLSIWGLTACSNPRVLTINQERTRPAYHPPIVAPIKRSEIKEEILLGAGSSNSSLGSRVEVPKNNPVLTQQREEEPSRQRSSEMIERMDFPVEEYKRIKNKGHSTVSGTIYLENSHTAYKIKGKRTKLLLNPVTSYSRQWYQESHLGGYKLSKVDERLHAYLQVTYSDNSGNFNFFGVPTGDYYLTGTITCSDECGFNQSKSIRLVREISVGRGVTTVDLMKSVP